MTTAIFRTGALTPAQRAAVNDLVARVAEHDGVTPLNEAALFAVEGRSPAVHWLAHRGQQLVGYAQADRDNHSVQLFVDADARREGIAAALVEQVQLVEKAPTWWAFGNGEGARAMSDRLGIDLARELLIMERDLVAHPVVDEPTPADLVIRDFQPTDAAALVQANADAFAHHPEQGNMTLQEFELRASEQSFDPAGLKVAIDDDSGVFLGFHWTKIENSDPANPDEPIGEVYVIGVRPEAAGRGIGRALLAAGLRHLASKGVSRVRLYVEASEARVVKMYQSASFVEITRDASYARRGETREF